jgi:hypothetical protein
MARTRKNTNTAPKKTATTTRVTRARSKEAVTAVQPPPIAPSRRSTRARSTEPLLLPSDPEKILKKSRKSRKTPEAQVSATSHSISEAAT